MSSAVRVNMLALHVAKALEVSENREMLKFVAAMYDVRFVGTDEEAAMGVRDGISIWLRSLKK